MDELLERLEVGLESLGVGGDDDQFALEVRDVVSVFAEEGCEGDDFVAGVEKSLEGNVQAAGRADGHQNVSGGEFGPETLVQGESDLFPDFREAGVRHVAVDLDGIVFGQDLQGGFFQSFRSGDVGVAQAEIVNVLLAVFPGELEAFLKHRPDDGIGGDHLLHAS